LIPLVFGDIVAIVIEYRLGKSKVKSQPRDETCSSKSASSAS
jgi:hypothetical protein